MKSANRYRILFVLLATAVALCGVVAAQQPRSRSLTLGGKDVSQKRDGMEIKILKDVGGRWMEVGQNDAFKAGDKVRVQFWSNLKGYVYFVNIAPGGKQKVIYSQAIEKDQDYTLPGREGSKEMYIEFDNEKGIEILKLVMSAARIKVFDDALYQSKGDMGENPFSVSNELLSGNLSNKQFEQVAMIQPKGAGCPRTRELNIRCRSLGFDPSDPKQGKGAVVVAIPDSKNGSGKLAKDEAIVVELRLKHL